MHKAKCYASESSGMERVWNPVLSFDWRNSVTIIASPFRCHETLLLESLLYRGNFLCCPYCPWSTRVSCVTLDSCSRFLTLPNDRERSIDRDGPCMHQGSDADMTSPLPWHVVSYRSLGSQNKRPYILTERPRPPPKKKKKKKKKNQKSKIKNQKSKFIGTNVTKINLKKHDTTVSEGCL